MQSIIKLKNHDSHENSEFSELLIYHENCYILTIPQQFRVYLSDSKIWCGEELNLVSKSVKPFSETLLSGSVQMKRADRS